jgi:hypothetical protein
MVLALALAVSRPAHAQQQMPDPSQIAGRPLPAPELTTGVVSVRVVRERMGNNIANQTVTLKTPDRTLTATTDDQGRAQFTGLAANTIVSAEAVVDGETLTSQSFPVPAQNGVRVALIAGIAAAAARERAAAEAGARQPARAGAVVFGGESRIIVEFQNDNLQVFYLLDIVNSARTPIDIGGPLELDLPDVATGAATMQGSSPLAMLQGQRLRIGGPFPPGTTSVQLGFRVPYRGNTVTLSQTWPAAFEQLFVAAEKVGAMQMASPQFEQTREADASGTPFLMATGGRINPGETLTLTLSGLPHRSTTVRDVGVAAGVLILVVGLWLGIRGAPGRAAQTTELTKRKDKLFAELVSLEAQHRRGRLDDERYRTKRETLMGQLERVMGELDRDPAGGTAAAIP